MKKFILTVFLLVFSGLYVSAAQAEVILFDDFNDGIDASRWSTPKNQANSNSQTVAQNGTAALQKRSMLVTQQDFSALELGGIQISGDLKNLSGRQFFSLLEYSDGLYSSESSGIANTGLEFRYREDQGATHCWRENGISVSNLTSLLVSRFSENESSATLAAALSSGVHFEFTDAGNGLAGLKFTSTADSSRQWQYVYSYDSATAAAAQNHKIAFQNHEGAVDQLDNLQISAMRGGFSDNFDGAFVDALNWTLRGGAQNDVVIDSSGRLTLHDRSGVASRSEYAPDYGYTMHVSGDFIFGSNEDMLTFQTRSDNSPTNKSEHVQNGLQFQTNIAAGFQTINILQKGSNFDLKILDSDLEIEFTVGKTYHFDIFDDGNFASFYIYDVLDLENSAFVEASAVLKEGSLYDSNFFVMYNREGNRTSYIDNFSLQFEQVPEPSTAALLLLGLLALAPRFARRRKSSDAQAC